MMHGGPRGLMGAEVSKPQNIGKTLARFLRYFGSYWPMLIIVVVLGMIGTWTSVTIPDLTGQLVDSFLTTPASSSALQFSQTTGAQTQQTSSAHWLAADPDTLKGTRWVFAKLYGLGGMEPPNPATMTQEQRIAGLLRLTLITVGLYVFGSLLNGATFYAMSWTGEHVLVNMRVDVFDHLHALSLNYYAKNEAGDLMSRITNDTSAIQQAFGFALVQVLGGAMMLVWVAINMLRASVAFTLLSLLVTPVMVLATLWFSGQARKAFRVSRKELGSVNAELQESISSVREVQAFNRADENIQQFRTVNAANRDANVRAVSFTAALSPSLEALGYVAMAVVTGVGGYAMLRNTPLWGVPVTLGLVISFMAYVQRFNQPIMQISMLWTNIQNALAGAERIFGLLDEQPGVTDRADAKALPAIVGRVEFEHVTAEYDKGVPVLKDVSFMAEPGKTIAIVGPTGAGKTTIINLIPRFYDVTGGAVRIDGTDVRDVTAESLRKQIGIVLQDTFLFSISVLENIRFGRPGASDEEVMAAARLARADTFIERLPDKYNTLLGERGSGLSQGQRQLIAIARAALADPRILILDEATSSVDTRTERLIQQALVSLLKGRTSFVIAHRLSTIRNADTILVIDQGEIVERGTHDELLAKQGVYYQLYMSQFRRQEQLIGGTTLAATVTS
jgi:ATP-binding cassette subfamily B protein